MNTIAAITSIEDGKIQVTVASEFNGRPGAHTYTIPSTQLDALKAGCTQRCGSNGNPTPTSAASYFRLLPVTPPVTGSRVQ